MGGHHLNWNVKTIISGDYLLEGFEPLRAVPIYHRSGEIMIWRDSSDGFQREEEFISCNSFSDLGRRSKIFMGWVSDFVMAPARTSHP